MSKKQQTIRFFWKNQNDVNNNQSDNKQADANDKSDSESKVMSMSENSDGDSDHDDSDSSRSDSESDTESSANESASKPTPNESASKPTPKKRKLKKHKSSRTFQSIWLDKWSFMRYENGKMHCHLCREQGLRNTLAKGTSNFRTSTITRHLRGKDHQRILTLPAEQNQLEQVLKQARSKEDEAIQIGMKAVFWLCKENLPTHKYPSLMSLLKELKVPQIEHLSVGTATYCSETTAKGFMNALSDVIDKKISHSIKESPVITVLTDESTDIVVHHKLAINIRAVDPVTLEPRTYFLSDIHIESGTGLAIFNAVKNELVKRGISLKSVFGLGTDGAAVMTGTKTGLTGQFLKANPHIANTHCSAHRVALVSEQAAGKVKAITEFKETVTSIYYYFHKSPARVQKITAIQEILNEPKLRYKEVHQVRWLSFYNALESIMRTLDSLITMFTTQSSPPYNDAKASGLKKKVANELFILLSYSVLDWLNPIMKLSLFFQREDLDISIVKVNVETCLADLQKMRDGVDDGKPSYSAEVTKELTDGTFKGHVISKMKNKDQFKATRRDFLQNMIDNLKTRFPENETMMQFAVLGLRPINFIPADDLQEWGNTQIKSLAEFYTQEQSHTTSDEVYMSPPFLTCAVDEVLQEWTKCKSIVKSCMYPVGRMEGLWHMLAKYHSADFPNLTKLAMLALTHPVHTSDCERTFSVQNHTVTPLRNRMSSERCDEIMRIITEGGNLADFDYDEALQVWRKIDRKIYVQRSRPV